MQNIHRTRFIAANYSNLQGLKAVPMGLLLLVVVIWANAQRGPASNLTVPLLFGGAMILLAWYIQRYYQTQFGKVESTSRQKWLEVLLGVGGGAVGLAAFLADVNLHLPFSCIGLMFAASFLAEYWRMQQLARGRYMLLNTLIYTTILLIVSLLPLFGVAGWWEWIGMRAQLYGVLVVASVVIVIAGLLGHRNFMRQLPLAEA